MANKIKELKEYLQGLSDRKFYGEIIVKFIDGEVTVVYKEKESIKL